MKKRNTHGRNYYSFKITSRLAPYFIGTSHMYTVPGVFIQNKYLSNFRR